MTKERKISANEIKFNYIPRKQFIPFHQRKQRWACMVVHRRGGKTVACVHEIVLRALYTKKKNADYAYIAPFYRQAKKVAWRYLVEATEDFAIKISESSLSVILPNKATITLYGSDNPDALRGIRLDGVIMDEFGDSRPSLWAQIILPCLSDRKGWAVFIGTPKGRNHFYKIYKRSQEENGWFSMTLKSSESGIIDNNELLEMKVQMTEAEYDQEMECSFTAAVIGTYYASLVQTLELNGKIAPKVIQYDPKLPVQAACDIGRTDSTAIWFWQDTAHGICVINYYESQGKDLDHYINFFKSQPYHLEAVWVPHDAIAKTLATKRSTIEQLLDAGLPCRKVPLLAVQHGIDAVRKILPTCWIDSDACAEGIEALRAYRRRFNELDKMYSETPLHDWSSDGADAFRYLSLVCKSATDIILDSRKALQDDPKMMYSFSLDDLYELRKQGRPRY